MGGEDARGKTSEIRASCSKEEVSGGCYRWRDSISHQHRKKRKREYVEYVCVCVCGERSTGTAERKKNEKEQ